MNFKKLAVIIFCLMITVTGYSQKDTANTRTKPKAPAVKVEDIGSVSGKVTDEKGTPLSYATVTLIRLDSSVVNGDLTKDNGSFSITPTGLGKFRLKIESIGAQTKFISVEITNEAQNKDVGKIKITQTPTALKGVEVVGERPIMELKVDKKVFNVEKNITSAGGSASDVLQNVPSVSVDVDGNVALRGKTDVTILIDGKPATLLGTDVASALQSLPAGSIDNIEVITNPSAKYDAQGTSGIINIITKKDGRLGINGTATLGAGSNDKYNGNLSLNLRKGKWNVFANGSFRLNSTYNDVYTDRNNKDANGNNSSSFYTYEHVPRHWDGSFSSFGASYDPNKYNSFTLTENLNVMQFGFKDTSNYFASNNPSNATDNPFFTQNRFSNFTVNILSLSSALDYKHKFKKKDEELSVDFTYAATDIIRNQKYVTYILTDSVKKANIYSPIKENAPATGGNSTINVWADYTDPMLTMNGKLGLGFKSQIFNFNSSNKPLIDSATKSAVIDSTLYAQYNYTTQVHAAYVNWSDQIHKFSYQAGLRLEYASYHGDGYVPSYAKFDTSLIDLFPSAFISYKLADNRSIYLNYSRRTNRPDFRSLMPFKDLSNPGTVNMGNPNLLPEMIDNVEFSFNQTSKKGDNIILSLYYSYTQNLMQRVTRSIVAADSLMGLKQEIGELLTQPINIASGTTYGIEGTGHLQFFKWWDATLNFNFFQNDLKIGSQDAAYDKYLSNNNGFSWFGKMNTSVKLPKSFTFQLNANYESPKVIAQGHLHEAYWVDMALRKNLWKNKATVVLNCSDIFNTHHFVTDYNLAAYSEVINRVKETRIWNLSFTYRFGKTDLKSKGGPGGGERKAKDDKLQKPNENNRESNLKDSEEGGGDQGGGTQRQGGNK